MVDIAEERISLLFDEAERAAHRGRMDLADRYVALARQVGMRYNVALPAHMRWRACRGCHGYLLPGATSRVRLNRGRASVTCLRCGHVTRVPLAPRQVKKRAVKDGHGPQGAVKGERNGGEGGG